MGWGFSFLFSLTRHNKQVIWGPGNYSDILSDWCLLFNSLFPINICVAVVCLPFVTRPDLCLCLAHVQVCIHTDTHLYMPSWEGLHFSFSEGPNISQKYASRWEAGGSVVLSLSPKSRKFELTSQPLGSLVQDQFGISRSSANSQNSSPPPMLTAI